MSGVCPVSPRILLPVVGAGALLVAGLAGHLNDAWGYGLFLVALLLLAGGLLTFSIFVFSRALDTEALQGTWTWLLRLGAWAYVWAIAAFSGFFTHETFAGRMEIEWILFGPAALAAIVIIDSGLYRLLVRKNLPTWQRFGHFVTREASDPAAMRRTFMNDVIVQRSLLSVSGFRWLRHALIFWGFGLMVALEMFAVMLREAWPAFGGEDIWEIPSHPLRLAFDFGFDFTGTMVLAGCILALIWRAMVNGTPEQKFADTPSVVFLFFVVASGFVLEAMRLSAMPADPIYWASFLGYGLAGIMPPVDMSGVAFKALWYIHVLGSCAFIAYVPVKRLVHSCATPVGRLMNSQKGLLAAKRQSTLAGLMGEQGDD
jgi:hypothetical protein